MSLEKILVLQAINWFEERDVLATTMRIFAKEIMVRQYKIDGLPYRVDLF